MTRNPEIGVKSLNEEVSGKQKKSSPKREELETQADSETIYEDKLDRALADTFPASDPIPWISDVRKARATNRKAGKDSGRTG